MIKRNERQIRNIASRMTVLQQIVVDGQDAEAVYKYAFAMKKEADAKMLEAARSGGDIEQQRSDYRAVCRLVEMLEHAAYMGKQKEKVLTEITDQG